SVRSIYASLAAEAVGADNSPPALVMEIMRCGPQLNQAELKNVLSKLCKPLARRRSRADACRRAVSAAVSQWRRDCSARQDTCRIPGGARRCDRIAPAAASALRNPCGGRDLRPVLPARGLYTGDRQAGDEGRPSA